MAEVTPTAVPSFHTFYAISLPSRSTTVQVAKFPTILDSFLLGVAYIRQVVGGIGCRWVRWWL